MLLTGLSEVVIGVLKDGKVATEDMYLLDSRTGGPTGVNIQGLNPQVEKLYGGDGIYLASSQGTGGVTVSVNALDLPQELVAKLTGMKKDETSGAYLVGNSTTPAEAAMMIRSHDKSGKSVYFGLFKGTFTRGDINPQTNEDKNKNATDTLTMTCSPNENGDVYAEAIEGVDGVTTEKFETLIFKTTVKRTASKGKG